MRPRSFLKAAQHSTAVERESALCPKGGNCPTRDVTRKAARGDDVVRDWRRGGGQKWGEPKFRTQKCHIRLLFDWGARAVYPRERILISYLSTFTRTLLLSFCLSLFQILESGGMIFFSLQWHRGTGSTRLFFFFRVRPPASF